MRKKNDMMARKRKDMFTKEESQHKMIRRNDLSFSVLMTKRRLMTMKKCHTKVIAKVRNVKMMKRK